MTFLLLSLIPSGALESSPLCLPEEHRGQFYVLTGPEEVDSGELAELVSTFTREVPKSFDLGYISCSHNELKRILDDLSDFFAMGLSLPTTGEHDRKLGLGPWILREGEGRRGISPLRLFSDMCASSGNIPCSPRGREKGLRGA